jgi:hypothetical protein
MSSANEKERLKKRYIVKIKIKKIRIQVNTFYKISTVN